MADMSLQGRLADFTLEEILQLIALQQKTGLLTVDASLPMALAFESGMLVGYRDRRRGATDPLEAFLKAYGFFPTESWEHIDFVSRHSQLDLTEILVNEGLLTAEELAQVQYEAAQEHLFGGMQLRDGAYNFTSGRDGLVGLKGRVRIKVDGLLMEAVRRIDEMPGLRERYVSPALKVRRTEKEADSSERNSAERRVLAVLGEESTVGRVVASGRMSEFDTLTTLESLRNEGIVSVQAPPKTTEVEGARQPSRAAREDRGSLARPALSAVIALALVVAGLVLQPWAPYRVRDTAVGRQGQEFALDRDQTRVEAALQLYHQLHKAYPAELATLEETGLLTPDLLPRVSRDLRYVPAKGRQGYELLRASKLAPGARSQSVTREGA